MSLLDALKPHRAEALQRVRTNAFCLVVLIVLSYLLPLPSIPTAVKHVLIQNSAKRVSAMSSRLLSTAVPLERWSSEWVYSWTCTIETTAIIVFLFNVLQGLYALKYPRTLLPTPTKSPADRGLKSKSTPSTPTGNSSATRHPFKALSPPGRSQQNQPQKPFTFSPTQSTSSTHHPSASLSGSSLFFSSVGGYQGHSAPTGSTSVSQQRRQSINAGTGTVVYPSTPADTPPRAAVKYTFPSGLDSSTTRSTRSSPYSPLISGVGVSGAGGSASSAAGGFPPSPTPVLAWRGKHIVGDVGRPLDGSFLGQICANGGDEEDE